MELFVSKPKVFKAILLGLLMTSASFYISAKTFTDVFPTERSVLDSPFRLELISLLLFVVGIAGFLIFGAMTIVFISRFFNTEPQLIINLEGIEDKRLGTGIIKWNEIKAVVYEKAERWQSLILILESPADHYRKLPVFQLFLRKMNGQTGINNLRIRFTDLDKPIDEVWQFIEEKVLKTREIDLSLNP